MVSFKKLFLLLFLTLGCWLLANNPNSVFAQYFCGDWNCDSPWESCASCPHDCGLCSPASPVPSGSPLASGSPLEGGVAVSCGWYCCPGYSAPCGDAVKGFEIFCWPDCSSSGAEVCYRVPDCYQGECLDCTTCGCGVDPGTRFEIPSCPEGMCGVVRCNGDTGQCYSTCEPGDCDGESSPTPPPGFACTCTPQSPQAPELITVTDLHSAAVSLEWNNSVDWGNYCCDTGSSTPDVCDCPWGTTCVAGTDNSGTTCNRRFKFYFDDDSNVFDSPLSTYTLGRLVSSQAVSGLTANTTYYWTVCSYNTYQTTCAPTQSFTPVNEPPSPATNGSPSGDIGTTEISFAWIHNGEWGTNIPGNDQHFYVDFSTTSGNYDWNDPECDVEGDDPGAYSCPTTFDFDWDTPYYWQVRASNNGDDFTDPNTYTDSQEWSFTANKASWWQTVGGDVHGQGVVSTIIPADTCTPPTCQPYLMLNDSNDQHGVVSFGGSFDLGSYCGGGSDDCVPDNVAEDDDTTDWNVNSSYAGLTYDYDWWLRHLRDETKASETFDGSDPTNGIYLAPNTISTQNAWTITNGNKVIVLVNGNFDITEKIKVNNGGFLLVVAKDKITIADSLGGSRNNGDVQGIFVADEIDFGTGDIHFYGEGSFIGWTSVSLGRDLGAANNADEPAMTFTFRPDLIINAPASVKNVYYPTWQQVPG